ncbi:MAG: sigma-70 family RNA polymerase sigma factor [Opitutaceae bacterium]
MIEDVELLRRYAEERSEEAFTLLVQRRVNLVYSVALRQVGGDVQLAEDITQRVFADLARKASSLVNHAVLSGWLYRSAQFAATDVVRAQRRRRVREQEAEIMNETSSPDAPADWEKLRPLLDQVLGELDADDRDALALRFFEERSYAEVGAAIRLTEDAARKRVSRALDKLHGLLASRGVTSTTAALGVALAGQTSVAAPAGFAATVASGAIASAAGGLAGVGGVGATAAFFGFMSTSKIVLGVVGVIGCVAIGVALFEVKASNETKSTWAALTRERDELRTKLHDSEGRLAAQSQRAAIAEEDTDKLLLVVKSMQVPVDAAPAEQVTRDLVDARYKRGQELARNGNSVEALKEFLWCFEVGMPQVSGYAGVRRSFLLSELQKLGPAGVDALQELRDQAQKRVLAGKNGADAAADFSAINRAMKEDDRSIALYDQLPPGDERRRALANGAYDQFVAARRYADAAQARSYGSMVALFETLVITPTPNMSGADRTERLRQIQHASLVESTAKNIEVLAGAGDLENAQKLAARLMAFDRSPETQASIEQHATRAGHPTLLSQAAR